MVTAHLFYTNKKQNINVVHHRRDFFQPLTNITRNIYIYIYTHTQGCRNVYK